MYLPYSDSRDPFKVSLHTNTVKAAARGAVEGDVGRNALEHWSLSLCLSLPL